MGKESKRVDIVICITDSLCCTAETNLEGRSWNLSLADANYYK